MNHKKRYAVSDSVSGAGSLLPSILEPFAPDVRRAVVCAEPTRGQALVFVWFESGLAGRRFEAYMNGQPFDREHGSEQVGRLCAQCDECLSYKAMSR